MIESVRGSPIVKEVNEPSKKREGKVAERTQTWTIPNHHRAWYEAHCCPHCGRVNDTGQPCPKTAKCRLCGAIVCMGVSAKCCVCRHGILEGFYMREDKCGYKDCICKAIAFGIRGKKYVCLYHGKRQGIIPQDAK